MTCKHISETREKLNKLVGKLNNSDDSSVYTWEGLFVNWDDVEELLKELEEGTKGASLNWCNQDDMMTWVASWGVFHNKIYGIEVFRRRELSREFIYEYLKGVFYELGECYCCSELETKVNGLQRELSESNAYKDRCNKAERELRDLRGEKEDEIKGLREELKTEKRERQNDNTQHNNEKLGWERDIGQKNAEISRKDEKIIGLENQVQEKDNQIGRLEIKLDEKVLKIHDLTGQMANLQLESNNKDNELKRKNEEIQRLKKWAELSQEELLKEKIRSERENLELFSAELGIDSEQIHSLSKYHERLFQAQKKRNQANIETHESNIARAKKELSQKNKISIVSIQEICRKCEKIAELRWELEQNQQRQIQMNDWKNINPNFTPELVQEWINHGFTYEECADWININPLDNKIEPLKSQLIMLD